MPLFRDKTLERRYREETERLDSEGNKPHGTRVSNSVKCDAHETDSQIFWGVEDLYKALTNPCSGCS